jgi:hypothetical protein
MFGEDDHLYLNVHGNMGRLIPIMFWCAFLVRYPIFIESLEGCL